MIVHTHKKFIFHTLSLFLQQFNYILQNDNKKELKVSLSETWIYWKIIYTNKPSEFTETHKSCSRVSTYNTLHSIQFRVLFPSICFTSIYVVYGYIKRFQEKEVVETFTKRDEELQQLFANKRSKCLRLKTWNGVRKI